MAVEPVGLIHYSDGVFTADAVPGAVAPYQKLADLLRQHPGIGKTEFYALAKDKHLGGGRARTFTETNITAGRIRASSSPPGPANKQLLEWVGDESGSSPRP